MARQFDLQLEQMKKQKEAAPQQKHEDQFDQIFSMYQTRKEMKAPVKQQQQLNSEVPDHLMADGSARLGEKVLVDQASIDEYNMLNRPKKLVDMHKELMQARGTQEDPKKRRPFSRDRDIMGQGKQDLMKNSTFFDFKGKMTKPANTNQFL